MTNVTPNFDISGLSSTVQDYLSLIYVMERDQEPVIGSRLAELSVGEVEREYDVSVVLLRRDGVSDYHPAGESRFAAGYASFLRTVPRAGVIRQGRVNPMQLAGLDGPLAQLISPCTNPACLDASQDRRFRHADSFRGLTEGVTHVLLSVPLN